MNPQYLSRYPEPDAIASAVEAACPGAVLEKTTYRQETTLLLNSQRVLDVCRFLQSDAEWKYALLADVAGVDWPKREKRFDVVYNLYSVEKNLRLRLKVQVAEGESIPSVTSLWRSADWAEREVFDLFGVPFSGHPDLRRILMPDDWQGHPLRKDFPLSYELPQFTHNLSERPEWLEQGLRWFGDRSYGEGRAQTSFPRQGPEGKPVAGWEGRPPEEKES